MRSTSPPTERPVELLLLRHAATWWSDQDRRQGWVDQPLTLAGRRASSEWADRAPSGFDAVVCSDLGRARDTAQIIAQRLALDEASPLSGLREQDQGAWTGLTKAEINRRWPGGLGERPRRPVGGEPPEVVLRRVLGALGRVAYRYAGRRVLAITHNGVIRALEHAVAVESPPVPHLEGRWFTVAGETAHAEPTIDWVLAGELTRGRVAGGASNTGRLAAEGR